MDESKDPVLHCPTCYSTNFRTSRVRPKDRLQLLVFKYPVRCKKCNARVYASRSYAKWLRKSEEARQAAKTDINEAREPSQDSSPVGPVDASR